MQSSSPAAGWVSSNVRSRIPTCGCARWKAASRVVGSAQARQALQVPLALAEIEDLLARAADLARKVAGVSRDETAAGLAGVFELTHSALTAAASPAASGAVPPAVMPRLVDSVLRPLADSLAGHPGEPRMPEAGADHQVPGAGPGGPAAGTVSELVVQAAEVATRLHVRLATGGIPGPELAEATAALQDLACQLTPEPTLFEWAGRAARADPDAAAV